MPEISRCPQCGGTRLAVQQADSGPGWRVHIDMRRWLAELAIAVVLSVLLFLLVQWQSLVAGNAWLQTAGYWLVLLPLAFLLVHLLIGAPFVTRRHPTVAQRLTCRDCGYQWLQQPINTQPTPATRH